jgi:hypothetical protein
LLEALEDRALPSVFTVTNTLDDGSSGTLRWAITQANADTDPVSTIDFNIPGSGVQTIQVGSSVAYAGQPLPAITHAVVINGYSQPGTSWNQQEVGDGAVLRIELDGQDLPGGDYSSAVLNLQGTTGCVVEGLAIYGAPGSNIYVQNGTGNTIQGNFIGLHADGSAGPFTPDFSNIAATGHAGIDITGGSGNLIGTDGDGNNDPGERNVIGGNNYGVILDATSSNVVAGNYIGTDPSGTRAVPNLDGLIAGGDRAATSSASPAPTGFIPTTRTTPSRGTSIPATRLVGRSSLAP